MKLSGSSILITGASGGIGGAMARQLAQRGASLILVNRDREKLEAFAAELREALNTSVRPELVEGQLPEKQGLRQIQPERGGANRRRPATTGGSVWALTGDLAVPGQAAEVVNQAIEKAGSIDILINCAGVQNFGFFAEESAADTTRLFNVNTVAPIAMANAVLPHMLKNGKGQIVNVGSIFGSIGFPCFATYSASKFALRGFSEALRRELTGTGVGVTYVAPRFTRTAFNRSVVARMANTLKMNQDEPESVAASVIASIERDDFDRYLGWPEKLFVRINSILPRLVDSSLMKQVALMRPFATERSR